MQGNDQETSVIGGYVAISIETPTPLRECVRAINHLRVGCKAVQFIFWDSDSAIKPSLFITECLTAAQVKDQEEEFYCNKNSTFGIRGSTSILTVVRRTKKSQPGH